MAHTAGRWSDGNRQVDRAREVLATAPDEATEAAVDVTAADLALDTPGSDRTQHAEKLARSAADTAERHGLPVVACQARELSPPIVRERDPEESAAMLQQALVTAERHRLPLQRMYVMHRPHRAKQTASTRKATGARVRAMTRPPTAGPTTAAVRAPTPISALAGVSSSSSTTEGRMETRAGWKKASTVPKAAAAAHSIHTVRRPLSPASPTAAISTARAQLEHDHQDAWGPGVAEAAAHQGEQGSGDGLEGQDVAEGEGGAGQPEGDPGERDDAEAVAEQGQGLSRPQEAEGPVPGGCPQPRTGAGEGGGHGVPFVGPGPVSSARAGR
ncbi:hypothetical protein SHIRM173S_06188 [Streptomyces hirsutus]